MKLSLEPLRGTALLLVFTARGLAKASPALNVLRGYVESVLRNMSDMVEVVFSRCSLLLCAKVALSLACSDDISAFHHNVRKHCTVLILLFPLVQ